MSITIKENFVEELQRVCLFHGEIVKEDNLKKGRFNGETAHMCDPSSYMDVELERFPQVFVTISKNQSNQWLITGGVVGVAEDGLGPFDNEAVAAYILSLLGYDVPVTVRMVEALEREPGAATDGSYFIPNIDQSQGLLIVLNSHRLAVFWQLEDDAESQKVIGENENDDTEEMFGMYFGENFNVEIEGGILTEGRLMVTDNGTPYRLDKYLLPNLQIEVGIELMHCMNWDARISYVEDLTKVLVLTSDNPLMNMINKELCDRGSVLRIREHPLQEGVYTVGMMNDSFVEGEVELPLNHKLKEFITLIYAAENLAIEFNQLYSRYWVKGYINNENGFS